MLEVPLVAVFVAVDAGGEAVGEMEVEPGAVGATRLWLCVSGLAASCVIGVFVDDGPPSLSHLSFLLLSGQ